MNKKSAMAILLMVTTVMLAGCNKPFVVNGIFYNLSGVATQNVIVVNVSEVDAEGGAEMTLENMHLVNAGAYVVYTQLLPNGTYKVYEPIYLAAATEKCFECGLLPAGLFLAGEVVGVGIPTLIHALDNKETLVIPMGNKWLVSGVVYAATNKGPFTVTLKGASWDYAETQLVEIPDLTGLTHEQVVNIFTGGCMVLVFAEASSDTVPAGTVIDWNPKGPVPCGTAINVTLSTGPKPPETVQVPSLAGLNMSQAQDVLRPFGLTVGDVGTASSNDVVPNIIIGWDPTGMVAPGTAINIIVSTGPQLVQIPDLNGLTEEEVNVAFFDSCLILGVVSYVWNNDIPSGYVVSWDPMGTVVCGTLINVVISLGPTDPGDVEVPSLAGLNMSQAQEILLPLGLTAVFGGTASSNDVPQNIIISWDPTGMVAPGTAVNIVVSTGPADPMDVEVPDLTDLTEDEADDAFVGSCLFLGAISYASDNTVPAGYVIRWSPMGLVPCGTTINVVISTGPDSIAVPNLFGLTQEEATTVLINAGLALGGITQAVNVIPAGRVFATDPQPGLVVPPGTEVNLSVSLGPEAQAMAVEITSPASGSNFYTGETVAVTVLVKGSPSDGICRLVVRSGELQTFTMDVEFNQTLGIERSFTFNFTLTVPGDEDSSSYFTVYLENDDGVAVYSHSTYNVYDI